VSRRVRASLPLLALATLLAVGACGGSSSPGAIDGDELAADFVAILTDPALEASIVQQATAVETGADEPLELRVTMGGDIALPDVSLRVAIEAGGQSTGFALVVAGDRSFVDLGEGWIEAPPGSVDTSELTDALVVVDDPADLAYAGAEEVDGETLHHLVAVRPLPYSPGGIPGTGDAEGTIDDLDAYVLADGTPVRIAFSFAAQQVIDGVTTATLGTSEIRFSDVGGDQVIVPPSLAPSPAAP
jgi:hypothetical protein